MNWLNLEIKLLISAEFIGSEPVDRATWICLLRFCCQQENNGIIKGCINWGDRKWMQLIGVTKAEVLKESLLWKSKGDDLIVWEYPINQQKAIQAKRDAGKRFGRGMLKANDSLLNSSPNSLSIDNSNSNSNSNSKENNKTRTFKQATETEFKSEVFRFKDYDTVLLQEFFDYWSEPNASGTMKFQLQQTWDTLRRLRTWERNQLKFNNKPATQATDHEVDALALQWEKEHGGK